MLNRVATSPYGRKSSAIEDAKIRVEQNDMVGLAGYQLRLAYVAISRHFAAAMGPLDLTQKQTGVLWLIGANAGVSQIALATELGMDRASMMAIVDRLEDRKMVLRERSRQDGRRQELYLTPKGRKVLAQSKTILATHERWITERFSEEEIATLMSLLKRIER
jgi:MarR family transcriptional regulator, organic hydroperoxide resistance regulator